MSGYGITLTYLAPQALWTASAHNRETRWVLGGLYTSAEAALAACWLTTDERIELPGIATYAQVRELLDARLFPDDDEVEAEPLDGQGEILSAGRVAAVVTQIPTGVTV